MEKVVSFGLEIEVHATTLIVAVDSIKVGKQLKNLDSSENIGPTTCEETRAFERIAHTILEMLGVANVEDRKKRIADYLQSIDETEFSLYGVHINAQSVPSLTVGS